MIDKIRLFIPPILFLGVSKLANILHLRRTVSRHSLEATQHLRWCPIQSGLLAGRLLFMNPEANAYQPTMLQGTFDQFLFDYIDRTTWSGKVIYDVGAHIAYHTLNFAQRVGEDGRVFSFEPHPMHLDRIKLNLSRNADLAARVTLLPVAASDNTGHLDLFSTEEVEGGGSSASFIEGASTPFPRSLYKQYQSTKVETVRLDDLIEAGKCLPPDLLKIDVEGAESLVIEGAIETLRKYKPRIVIEVHSLPNMLRLTTLLLPMGYSFIILEEEDRRCFVAVEPRI